MRVASLIRLGGYYFWRKQFSTTTRIKKRQAEQSKLALVEYGRFIKQIVTGIIEASFFYPAEWYHQEYDQKNVGKYAAFKKASGRALFIRRHWGDQEMSKEVLKKQLTAIQYEVTQNDGTETPFENEYWDEEGEGIYVDIISRKPLFSSTDKYDAGCGWPSFTKTIATSEILEKEDTSRGRIRTEVRSKVADAHLGHVFSDGPGPTKQRFCINSAALVFIPKEKLETEGYAEYLSLFSMDRTEA